MGQALTGNMVIAQSGGPTAVINESLVGAVLEARRHACIRGIYGSLNGIKGLLGDRLVDLRRESEANLEKVALTPSSALGSVRKKPKPEECVKIFEALRRYGIRYFFYIGGNDSAETVHIINREAERAAFDLRCYHIPKTIDNDLRSNDHTPGYASAAKFVALAMMGDNLDNRSLPGVKIDVIMGRNAGFLTAAAALARVNPDDGPHLIYLPERPFSPEKFRADVQSVFARLGRCVVAVSEGIRDTSGEEIAAKFCTEVDSHGNKQLSGSGALGDYLAKEVKALGIDRVRADTFGYLQRSFPAIRSERDAREARAVGAAAVRCAVKGEPNGSIAIRRKPGKSYAVAYERVALDQVARDTRHVPDEFIAQSGADVTPAFLAYLKPIVGPVFAPALLKAAPVAKARAEAT